MITGAQSEFIEKIASRAQIEAILNGIHVVSPIIAQAIIESNWGKSGLATKGKNLFGIKCGSSWKGASINMQTKEEYTPGTLTNISAYFRKYNSWDDSIKDYFNFIHAKRYEKLFQCYTPLDYCTEIKKAGYATSSTYVQTLMNCINSYNLTIYDDFEKISAAQPETITETIPETAQSIPITPVTENVTSTIDYSKVVSDVIAGLYGTGDDRIVRLAKNGYNPMAIQFMVNQQITIDDLTNENNIYYNIIQKIREEVTI